MYLQLNRTKTGIKIIIIQHYNNLTHYHFY